MKRTERFMYYRKSVMLLLNRMYHVRLGRCSTDWRKILRNSVVVRIFFLETSIFALNHIL